MANKFAYELTRRLVKLGKAKREVPPLSAVGPLKHYFSREGKLECDNLDEYDGGLTRREILARYLLVNVVLDQGPDVTGVRELLKGVSTELYRREIRIFHRPIDFFREIGVSIDEILERHESIKRIRAGEWARENQSIPSKYNLFFAQSMRGMISTRQVLDYTIHRWGVPLCVPLLLERDSEKKGTMSSQPLVDYLESHESAETMARRLKSHERYGLGSAIGDKACHLFAKLYTSVFRLVKYRTRDRGWTGISYEVPFDSNAGRVLFRTGFLLEWATLGEYRDWEVIQPGSGKGGTHYIRVTNIRGKKTRHVPSQLLSDYIDVVRDYLRTGHAPRSVEIQHLVNLLVYELVQEGEEHSVADFDDGLMHVGTNYCFNHENPICEDCPLKDICRGHNSDSGLITDYTT